MKLILYYFDYPFVIRALLINSDLEVYGCGGSDLNSKPIAKPKILFSMGRYGFTIFDFRNRVKPISFNSV